LASAPFPAERERPALAITRSIQEFSLVTPEWLRGVFQFFRAGITLLWQPKPRIVEIAYDLLSSFQRPVACLVGAAHAQGKRIQTNYDETNVSCDIPVNRFQTEN
jgi:hypothetical protein